MEPPQPEPCARSAYAKARKLKGGGGEGKWEDARGEEVEGRRGRGCKQHSEGHQSKNNRMVVGEEGRQGRGEACGTRQKVIRARPTGCYHRVRDEWVRRTEDEKA